MGVMVACQDILAKAKVEGADIIGLSGLITPSLEEMQHVATEMQRDDFFRIRKIPLLIGGATTSRVHTAVKIAPHYEGPGRLRARREPLGRRLQRAAERRPRRRLRRRARGRLRRVRAQHASKKATPLVSLAEARANKTPIDWAAYTPPAPKFIGRRVLKNQDLAEIAEVIDWGPFFQTWELAGPYPAILTDEIVGESARRLLSDGKRMLRRVIEGRWLRANGVVGLYPAATVGDDDIEIYADESRSEVLFTWRGLRVQSVRPVIDGVKRPEPLPGRLHRAQGLGQGRLHRPVRRHRRPRRRQEGAAVRGRPRRLQRDHAEGAGRPPRRGLRRTPAPARAHRSLGLRAPTRRSTLADLVAERYRGIRPAPGYPACPDHSVKRDLFRVLGCDEIGMSLTESLAMLPAASVSGFYLAHPEATYFNVGKIGPDQLRLGRPQRERRGDAERALTTLPDDADALRRPRRSAPLPTRLITSGATPCKTRTTRQCIS